MVQNNSTDNYATSRFIVSSTAGQGNYTTIASAITAASSGNTIYIMDGTYTENLTLKFGVNLSSLSSSGTGDYANCNTTIVGKMTDGGSGVDSTIFGIRLQTNSDYCVSVSGTSSICFSNCDFEGANSVFNITNSSGNIDLANCSSTLTAAVGLYTITNGILRIKDCYFRTLSTPTSPSASSGSVLIQDTVAGVPLSVSGTCSLTLLNSTATTITSSSSSAVTIQNSYITSISTSGAGGLVAGNSRIDNSSTAITMTGSSISIVNNCYIYSSSSSAISIGASENITVTNSTISSSNTNCITGSGTLVYGNLTFTSSSTINASTQTPLPLTIQQGGTFKSSFTPYAVVCGGTSSTGALQSVASVGISGYVLTSNGAGTLPTFQVSSSAAAFQAISIQVFTSSGTYTPNALMIYCAIEVWGGGGAGGGSATATASVGLGGGAGGYSKGTYSLATVGASQTVTIGAAGVGVSTAQGGTGGTTSVGSLIQATGGTGGARQNTPLNNTTYAGGVGGVGSLGSINLTGNPGETMGYGVVGGAGGSTIFGSGAPASNGYAAGLNVAAISPPASSYGAGGSGSANGAVSNGAKAGSNGVAGIVIITEFLS